MSARWAQWPIESMWKPMHEKCVLIILRVSFCFFFIHTIIVRILIKSKIEHISYNISCKIGVTTNQKKKKIHLPYNVFEGKFFSIKCFFFTPHWYRTIFSCLLRMVQNLSHTSCPCNLDGCSFSYFSLSLSHSSFRWLDMNVQWERVTVCKANTKLQ